jgi:hypothetical protein
MRCLFSATNSVPQSSELLAFYDRFLFRVRVDNAGEYAASQLKVDGQRKELSQSLHEMVKTGWAITYGADKGAEQRSKNLSRLIHPHGGKGLLEQLRDGIREEQRQGWINDAPSPQLSHMVSVARQRGLSKMSNRRIIKMAHAMLLHRLYRQATREDDLSKPLGKEDLSIVWRYCLDAHEPIGISKMADMPWE